LTTVTVVEDSDIVREVMRNFLADIPGLSVIAEFCCAPTAIEGIRRDPPDVLLLDIQLHAGNGMDVMKAISAEYQTIKVIVVTSFADAVYRRHYIDAGAYGFYDKCRELSALRYCLEKLAGPAAGPVASAGTVPIRSDECRHNPSPGQPRSPQAGAPGSGKVPGDNRFD
jgi:DNA-binding NarL/FixJ family response regulator